MFVSTHICARVDDGDDERGDREDVRRLHVVAVSPDATVASIGGAVTVPAMVTRQNEANLCVAAWPARQTRAGSRTHARADVPLLRHKRQHLRHSGEGAHSPAPQRLYK